VVDQEAFTAAGLALPQPGWTWTDFQASLQTLAEKVPGLQAPVFADELITPGQVSIGDYLLKPVIDEYMHTSGANFDPQGIQEQVGWYQDYVARGLIEPVQTVEAGASQRNAWTELYPDGQPPMWVGSVNSEPLNGKTNGVANLLPFPVSENSENDHTTPLYASCGVVSSGSLHPREAFTWLNFLSEKQIQSAAAGSYGTVPARKSVAEAGDFWLSLPENIRETYQFALQHGWYGSANPVRLDQVTNVLVESLAQGTSFSTGLAEALNQAPAQAPSVAENGTAVPIQVATPRPQNDTGEPVTFFTYEVFGKQDVYQQLADEFNSSHPGYQVQLPSFSSQADFPGPDDDLFSFYAEHYDCFESDLSEFQPQKLDLVYDLAPLLDKEDSTFVNDFYPWMLRLFEHNGKVFGLPTSYQPEVMFYNATLLQELGVPSPDLEWSFDDFMQMATQASGQGPNGQVYGFVPFAPTDIYLFLAGHKVNWVDNSTSLPKTRFDQPDVQAGFLWLQSLEQAGILPLVTPLDSGVTTQSLINSGQAAFWTEKITADWGGWYIGPDGVNFDIGVAPLPSTPAGSPVSANRVVGMFISSRSNNPQLCWDWIKFLSEKSEVAAGTPTRRSILNSPAWQTLTGEQRAKVYQAALAQGETNTIFLDSSAWFTQFYWGNIAYKDILNGQDASQALLAAQQKSDTFLQCLQAAGATLEDDGSQAGVVEDCSLAAQGISR
jgi:ABC-type glycerol-3-phosphate transport system substrate-binding protein